MAIGLPPDTVSHHWRQALGPRARVNSKSFYVATNSWLNSNRQSNIEECNFQIAMAAIWIDKYRNVISTGRSALFFSLQETYIFHWLIDVVSKTSSGLKDCSPRLQIIVSWNKVQYCCNLYFGVSRPHIPHPPPHPKKRISSKSAFVYCITTVSAKTFEDSKSWRFN